MAWTSPGATDSGTRTEKRPPPNGFACTPATTTSATSMGVSFVASTRENSTGRPAGAASEVKPCIRRWSWFRKRRAMIVIPRTRIGMRQRRHPLLGCGGLGSAASGCIEHPIELQKGCDAGLIVNLGCRAIEQHAADANGGCTFNIVAERVADVKHLVRRHPRQIECALIHMPVRLHEALELRNHREIE